MTLKWLDNNPEVPEPDSFEFTGSIREIRKVGMMQVRISFRILMLFYSINDSKMPFVEHRKESVVSA